MLKLVLLVLFLLFLLLTCGCWYLHLDFVEQGNSSNLQFTVYAPGGIRVYRYALAADRRKAGGLVPVNWKALLEWLRWLRELLPLLRLDRCYWRTSVGMGDAALTGWLVGLFWALQSGLLRFLFASKLNRAVTVVTPVFTGSTWSTRFEFRARLPLLRGLNLFYRLLRLIRKRG
ncbi:DUF2953 domain-containing protein [Desulfothermobacter acidiphilus]|uniref:DUF2953 domain-containing protein n=1 Tax=Desulfothermobacter acidiphilus TaxID=1938353 RepID=UPI003F8AFF9C